MIYEKQYYRVESSVKKDKKFEDDSFNTYVDEYSENDFKNKISDGQFKKPYSELTPSEKKSVDKEFTELWKGEGYYGIEYTDLDSFYGNDNTTARMAFAGIESNTPKAISEAYHKAKADGSNPELVKAVEDLLGKPKTQTSEQPTKPVTKPIPEVTEATKEQGVKEAVPEGTIETGRTEPEGETAVLEGKDQNLSGIRKALVSDEIIKGVDLERVSDKEMMDMGRKILDTGEIKPDALVEKIITEGRGVLTPTEVVGLITYKRDIDNALQDTYTKIAEKKAKGEDIGTLGVEAKNLERQIHDFDVMDVITAQQQSMAFRLRQRMLDREYNVVTQIEKYKANKSDISCFVILFKFIVNNSPYAYTPQRPSLLPLWATQIDNNIRICNFNYFWTCISDFFDNWD